MKSLKAILHSLVSSVESKRGQPGGPQPAPPHLGLLGAEVVRVEEARVEGRRLQLKVVITFVLSSVDTKQGQPGVSLHRPTRGQYALHAVGHRGGGGGAVV
jgi:hypothetical protein